ncbi:uncharacterized protein ACA1_243150 [Acanthamoeba castellanii str. Neff]|uniref:Uncharacterized protein n=1 Tax=Acanthamoeba castellanii (strain ATCC 30010 / Neff) TaxID=1257118 RepID=L8GJX6_ACACF|nr:uncharacterized protein ACA1_243150 [Acanthamoeba castellanii str. Neff]ELR13385.1 hypothetical protein ACA1_243150 [Acanthamoeba castellanii str. Neff]
MRLSTLLLLSSSDCTPLHISLYSFLIQSLELPNPSPHPITSPTTPYHILYEANPTYYLSFCAALYSSFVCLSSTPIAEGNISSLSNWLLTFHSKFLEESDLTAITSFLQGLTSHPALAPLTPKTSSSSSSGPWKDMHLWEQRHLAAKMTVCCTNQINTELAILVKTHQKDAVVCHLAYAGLPSMSSVQGECKEPYMLNLHGISDGFLEFQLSEQWFYLPFGWNGWTVAKCVHLVLQ